MCQFCIRDFLVSKCIQSLCEPTHFTFLHNFIIQTRSSLVVLFFIIFSPIVSYQTYSNQHSTNNLCIHNVCRPLRAIVRNDLDRAAEKGKINRLLKPFALHYQRRLAPGVEQNQKLAINILKTYLRALHLAVYAFQAQNKGL